jgi:hypothetical protein
MSHPNKQRQPVVCARERRFPVSGSWRTAPARFRAASRAGIFGPLAAAATVVVIVLVAYVVLRYLGPGGSSTSYPVTPASPGSSVPATPSGASPASELPGQTSAPAPAFSANPNGLVSLGPGITAMIAMFPNEAVLVALRPAVAACPPVSGVEEAEITGPYGNLQTFSWQCHPAAGPGSGELISMAGLYWEQSGTANWVPSGWLFYTAGGAVRLAPGQLAATEAQAGAQAAQEDAGIADSQVTSVAAVLPGGQVHNGVITPVPGFPYAVWAAAYQYPAVHPSLPPPATPSLIWPTTQYDPSGEWSTTLAFSNASGAVVARMPMLNGPAGSYGGVPAVVTGVTYGAGGSVRYDGVADAQVWSVTGVLPDGSRLSGAWAGTPAPEYRRWEVNYSGAAVGTVTLVFRDSAGHELDTIQFLAAGQLTPSVLVTAGTP